MESILTTSFTMEKDFKILLCFKSMNVRSSLFILPLKRMDRMSFF
ncbi:hypothetical protein LEP1GSC062_1634 [Leptospira alexanderi serovar Manhao 3 str. L 60]|uniref:Uncharacterized protein n=1 Tax=Leptospira alexanderi serovar Manhao 3 str. L 60 TaxID=1049759 RepID=V6HVI4_9LEPT|nr:hypothetical protein LEP1GSC062_1634 [Leptospira alexanderi serovar Manhao 3 str. L 60]